ncbi:MAG: hypothetical protein HDR01_16220 [Lachnospiraceae bacterium]|nr:hypothetical protein [Lachnospiraceae bacterium]
METNQSLNALLQETELHMQKMQTDKTYSFNLHQHIQQHVDFCLGSKQYEALFDLLPYFEAPDSYPQFHNSSETIKIYVLINILKLELENQKTPFLSVANDFDSIMEQYLLTVFSMRRLELALSKEAMDEAAAYLTSVPLTIYAAFLISTHEYFENYGNLFWNLYTCMKSFWPLDDKILWLMWLLEKTPAQQAILELASLYIEIHDYSKAYQILNTISSPSKDITDQISSLKELLSYV